jgi:hypothetical protein
MGERPVIVGVFGGGRIAVKLKPNRCCDGDSSQRGSRLGA